MTINHADILLICEGAYPYIAGGVSSWVQTVISSLPELKFKIYFLGSRAQDYQGYKYKIPDNVVDIECYYLFEKDEIDHLKVTDMSSKNKEKLGTLHHAFKEDDISSSCNLGKMLIDIIDPEHGGISYEQFHHSQGAWDFVTKNYEQFSTDPSFIDYFWTVKNIHMPIWRLSTILKDNPNVKMIHSVSTGYAGLLGMLLKQKYNIPFLLSEHGLYSKERKIELLQSSFLNKTDLLHDEGDIGYICYLWIKFFEVISRLCYAYSDKITALTAKVKQIQSKNGADEKKIDVVPNGVDVKSLTSFRHSPPKDKIRLGFLGRVVPIKDVKTLIRAVKILYNKHDNFDIKIIGPLDEDKEYAEECFMLTKTLELQDVIEFQGRKKLAEAISSMDIMILSSISEGSPLVIPEAFSAGIPVVATNVGFCEELIYGADEEDMAIGKAGRIVPISSPKELAQGIYEMMDEKTWQQASASAITRVEKYYQVETMIARLNELYQSLL